MKFTFSTTALSLALALTTMSQALAETIVKVIGGAPEQVVAAPANPWAPVDQAAVPAHAPTPQAQVFAPVPAIDQRPFWQAIADGDWASFDDLVKRAQRADASWAPSTDMLAKRQEAQNQTTINAAIPDNVRLIALSQSLPDQFNCGHANNIWHLGDAYTATGDKSAAIQLYRKVAMTCDADTRYAAIEKARAITTLADVVAMIDLPGIDKDAREGPTREAILKAIGDMSHKPGSGAPSKYGLMLPSLGHAIDATVKDGPTPQIAIDAAPEILKKQDAKGAELLGWLYHKSNRETEAVDWFRKATSWGSSRNAKAGLVYALLGTDQAGQEEARRITAASPGLVPANILTASTASQALFAAKDAKDFAKCQALAAASPDVASKLAGAWCAHDAGADDVALRSFKIIALAPATPEKQQQEAVKGWTVAAQNLHNEAEIDDLSARGYLADNDKKQLTTELGMTKFWDLYKRTQYGAASDLMAKLSANGIFIAEKDQIVGGWAAYQAGKCDRAWTIFTRLSKSTDEKIHAAAEQGVHAANGAFRSDGRLCGAINDQSGMPKNSFFD